MVNQWSRKYHPSSWPVLAFTGAPASFPVQSENKKLQKCLVWNDKITREARTIVKKNLPRGAYVGIHLRNGIDWVKLVRINFNIFYYILIFSITKIIIFRKF